MRFDTHNRIMSFSYERDPQEHIDVMSSAAQRWASGRTEASQRYGMLLLVGYVVGFGLLLELYRRYILTHIAPISSIPPASIALLQALPVFALIWLVLSMHGNWNDRQARKRLETRMAGQYPIRIEIYPEGVCAMADKMRFELEWAALVDIVISESRIDFDCDTWTFHIPFRSFDGPDDYAKRAREIRALWQNAVKAGAAAAEQPVGS